MYSIEVKKIIFGTRHPVFSWWKFLFDLQSTKAMIITGARDYACFRNIILWASAYMLENECICNSQKCF